MGQALYLFSGSAGFCCWGLGMGPKFTANYLDMTEAALAAQCGRPSCGGVVVKIKIQTILRATSFSLQREPANIGKG